MATCAAIVFGLLTKIDVRKSVKGKRDEADCVFCSMLDKLKTRAAWRPKSRKCKEELLANP